MCVKLVRSIMGKILAFSRITSMSVYFFHGMEVHQSKTHLILDRVDARVARSTISDSDSNTRSETRILLPL